MGALLRLTRIGVFQARNVTRIFAFEGIAWGKRPKPRFISKLAHVTQTLPRIDGSGAHHKEDAAVRASLKVNSVKRNIGGIFSGIGSWVRSNTLGLTTPA